MPTFTLEQIDKTIFEIIRRKVVQMGYLPDWRTTVGATQQDKQTNFNAAKDVIRNDKGFVVNVFGVGSGVSRDEKKTASIIINRASINPVKSGFGLYYFKEDPTQQLNGQNAYQKKQLADSVTIGYEIRAISENTQQERVVAQILMEAIGTSQKSVKAIDLTTNELQSDSILLRVASFMNVSAVIDFIEYLFIFSVPEISILPDEIIEDAITAQVKIIAGLQIDNEANILSPQIEVIVQ